MPEADKRPARSGGLQRSRRGTVNGDPQPFFNESRARWELRVTLPADEAGKVRRRVLRDPTKGGVLRQRNALLRELQVRGNAPTRLLTVGAFAETWLEAQRSGSKRAKTFIEYESVTRRYIVPHLGKRRLAELQPAHVEDWLGLVANTPKASGAGAGVVPVTVHVVKSARKVLSAMLTRAEKEGLVSRNVAHGAEIPEARSNDLRAALTVREARDVLERLAHSGDPLWTLWAAAILSGMRAGELAGLRREAVTDDAVYVTHQLQRLPHVHGCGGACGPLRAAEAEEAAAALEDAKGALGTASEAERVKARRAMEAAQRLADRKRKQAERPPAQYCPKARIREPKGTSVERLHGALCLVGNAKTDAGTRSIPNYAPLRAVLMHQMQTSTSTHGLMWERDGKPIDPNNFSGLWAGLEPSLKIGKHIVPHAMRNTTAGLMYTAGVPEIVIQQVLGHTDSAMSRSYARQDMEEQARELEAITRMLQPEARDA